MSQSFDFHCHSTASDGVLSPARLLERAVSKGVSRLALTDHDTIAGVRWLFERGIPADIELITGCEVSTRWAQQEIHIVALDFALEHLEMNRFMARQRQARLARSERIADKLARRLPDYSSEQILTEVRALARDSQVAADPNFVLGDEDLQLGRPHFASWLQQQGVVANKDTAFRKYIGSRHIGNAKEFWPAMAEAVEAIRSWGGIPVLAHPGHYRLSGLKLTALIKDFVAAGGLAMEVVGCQQPYGEREKLARLCQEHQLYASCGSDFHGPWSEYVELGRLGAVPDGCRSVTELLAAG